MERIWRAVDGVMDRISKLCLLLSALLLTLMMVLIAIEVTLRRAAGIQMNVALEMSGYALVAITFLAGTYSLRTSGFIRVTLLYDRLGPAARAFLRSAFDILGFVFVWLVTLRLASMAMDYYKVGTTSSTGNRTPLYIPMLVVVVAAAIFSLGLAVEIVRNLRDLKIGIAAVARNRR